MENINIITTINKKELNTSDNPKAPHGYIFPIGEDIRITVWKKQDYEKIPTGVEGELSYTKAENGIFTNYTYQSFEYTGLTVNKDKITFTEEMIKEFPENMQDKLPIGDGEVPYELFGVPVKQSDVDEIVMPREVLLKLIEALK